MSRGRKPSNQNVVPLAEDVSTGHNFEQRGQLRAAELKPEDLPADLGVIYDRLAPPLCLPNVNRLSAVTVFMFVQLCRAVLRHERLADAIEENGSETYLSKGRQGEQWKALPEIAQLNETFRQIRGLAGEFGMTPSTERGLTNAGQLPFEFTDPNSPDAYLT